MIDHSEFASFRIDGVLREAKRLVRKGEVMSWVWNDCLFRVDADSDPSELHAEYCIVPLGTEIGPRSRSLLQAYLLRLRGSTGQGAPKCQTR